MRLTSLPQSQAASQRQSGAAAPVGVDKRPIAVARTSSPAGSSQEGRSGDLAEQNGRRQLLLGLTAMVTSGAVAGRARAQEASTFLASTGARGPLVQEEERLVQLRQEQEGQARAQQALFGQLCATPYGVDIVGVTEFVALVGALVGGITARHRKMELERLNEQLRKINLGLRQQARAGTVYAPALTYAPAVPGSTHSSNGDGNGAALRVSSPHGRPSRPSVSADAALASSSSASGATAVLTAPQPVGVSVVSTEEEEMTAQQLQCRETMREGKRLLKSGQGAGALVRFEKALMLCKGTGDKVQERRAMRGLAAAARLQGQYRSAIKHLERVLEISNQMREHTGDADAYGSIADNYTDMGEYEKAAFYYDKYIERLNGSAV